MRRGSLTGRRDSIISRKDTLKAGGKKVESYDQLNELKQKAAALTPSSPEQVTYRVSMFLVKFIL